MAKLHPNEPGPSSDHTKHDWHAIRHLPTYLPTYTTRLRLATRRAGLPAQEQGVKEVPKEADPAVDGGDGVEQAHVAADEEVDRVQVVRVALPHALALLVAPAVQEDDVAAGGGLVGFPLEAVVVVVVHIVGGGGGGVELPVGEDLAQQRDARADDEGAAGDALLVVGRRRGACAGPGPAAACEEARGGVDDVVEAGEAEAREGGDGAGGEDGGVDKVGAEQVDADGAGAGGEAVARGAEGAEEARDAVLGGDVLGDAGQEGQAGPGADEEEVAVAGVAGVGVGGAAVGVALFVFVTVLLQPEERQVRRVHGPDEVHLQALERRRGGDGVTVATLAVAGEIGRRVLEAAARDGAVAVADAGAGDDGVDLARRGEGGGAAEEGDLAGPRGDVRVDEVVVLVARVAAVFSLLLLLTCLWRR